MTPGRPPLPATPSVPALRWARGAGHRRDQRQIRARARDRRVYLGSHPVLLALLAATRHRPYLRLGGTILVHDRQAIVTALTRVPLDRTAAGTTGAAAGADRHGHALRPAWRRPPPDPPDDRRRPRHGRRRASPSGVDGPDHPPAGPAGGRCRGRPRAAGGRPGRHHGGCDARPQRGRSTLADAARAAGPPPPAPTCPSWAAARPAGPRRPRPPSWPRWPPPAVARTPDCPACWW